MKTQFKKLFTLSLCLLCFGFSSYAQGIKWTEGLSWELVKAKAKAENKYIFVDCYATWCGPCKQMDKEIYPLDTVGRLVNDKFISIKVQMDSTKDDSENVKKTYSIARTFEKTYGIAGLPTYLFFSSEGEIIHKAMGFQKADDFIQQAKDVQYLEKQLYTQIKSCRDEKMDVNLVPVFIRRLNDDGDKTTALELARAYMKNHLEALPEARFATKENLQFMWDFQEMLNSDDRIFEVLFEKPEIVNNIYNNSTLADLWVENIFRIEYFLPAIKNAMKNKTEPDWSRINAKIVEKSDSSRAAGILINAKHIWYCVIKDWEKACDYEIMRFQRKDLTKLPEAQVCAELNTIAWTLFSYCFNKKQLEQGLAWINEALALDESLNKPHAGRMDTKANLLYKLGRQKEAIALETEVVSLVPAILYKTTLENMKLGKPTWATSAIGRNERKVK